MLKDTIAEVRAEAKRLGVPWSWVVAAKVELVNQENEQREHPNAIRRAAWERYVGAGTGSAPFWRHGFRARFGRMLAKGGDYTKIPRYDRIAYSIAEEFPEFAGDHAGDVSGCERLWEFLLSDYEPLPSRESFYWEALDMVAAYAPATAAATDEVPF